ncbi:hypothetical protein F7725_020354 [Dissostichus mawsoni]|uniref:Uncharacterized protein n=1 Tax=Dissostichus mawsoni TaxID=36200 RepID=A0A7J5YCZ2_DISMA|nr:hypothetical protein F7725_020354 [Dissostichus mawsoni]
MYLQGFSSSQKNHFSLSGLGITNGDRWRQLRRFTLTTLRDFGMGRKGMEQWIQEESQHLRDRVNMFKGVFSAVVGDCGSIRVQCDLPGVGQHCEDQKFLSLLQIISDTLKFGSSP